MTTKVQRKVRPKAYLSNKDLYCELIVSKSQGKLTRAAEKMLILLGKNIIKKFYYSNPDDKFDCLQNGYIQMFSNWYSFDETRGSNAFAYFTEVFKRGAAAGWKSLKRTKGDDDAIVISLTGYTSDGEQYERF